jgi:hypothetical protein
MLALAPVPTEGEPVGLKLQLYVYGGTPNEADVEAFRDCPAQTVVLDRLIGLVAEVCSTVLPSTVIVHGLMAPMQVLLQPPDT